MFFAVWNLAPLCLIWILWRDQNFCTFEDVEVSESQLKISFVRSLSSTITEFTELLSFACNSLGYLVLFIFHEVVFFLIKSLTSQNLLLIHMRMMAG